MSARARRESSAGSPLLGLAAGLAAGFGYAPREAIQGNVQRIMYVHVPAVLTAYLAFGLVLVGSIGALATRRAGWDRLAGAAAELGVLFTGRHHRVRLDLGQADLGHLVDLGRAAHLHRGAVPRLRGLPPAARHGGRARARAPAIAAVVGILGAANIPIVHFSVKWWRALHQPSTILGPEPSPIAGPIAAALFVNWVAFTLLFRLLPPPARWRSRGSRTRGCRRRADDAGQLGLRLRRLRPRRGGAARATGDTLPAGAAPSTRDLGARRRQSAGKAAIG